MQETQVCSLGQEDPLEKEMAAHSSILAWEIPWREEPGWLQCMGHRRLRHDWATKQQHSWFTISCKFQVYSTWNLEFSLIVPTLYSSVQSLSHVWLFVTPWTGANQATLSITNCWSLPKAMSTESVMPSNHLYSKSLLVICFIHSRCVYMLFPNSSIYTHFPLCNHKFVFYASFCSATHDFGCQRSTHAQIHQNLVD